MRTKVRPIDASRRAASSTSSPYFVNRTLLLRNINSSLIYCSGAGSTAPRSTKFVWVYDAYVQILERCSSESEDNTADILERCISQSDNSIWRYVKSSRESGDDENELGCGIRPKMNSGRIFGIPHHSRTNFGLRLVYGVGLGLGLVLIFV